MAAIYPTSALRSLRGSLHVLIEDGTLPDTLRTDVQALAAAGVVDLILTTEELLGLAADERWRPASAAAALTRAAFWTRYQPALETFLEIIGNVSTYVPAVIPAWHAAACHGLATSIPAADVPDRLANLADAAATEVEGPAFAPSYGGWGSRVSPVWARNPSMRAGRYWIRLSRFLMTAVSWSTLRAIRLPRPFFMFAQAPSTGLRSGA